MINNPDHEINLGVFISHPVQYKVPLFRQLASKSAVNLIVYFYSDTGLVSRKNTIHGLTAQWDIPLLEGYYHKFLPNWIKEENWKIKGLTPHLNPSVISRMFNDDLDVVMIHSYYSMTDWLVWFIAKMTNKRILFYGDLIPKGNRPKFQALTNRLIANRMVRGADACLAIGTVAREVFIDEYHIPATRIFLAPYAIDNDWFINQADKLINQREQIRHELGIRIDETVILCVAGMVPKKRQIDLIDAMSKVHGKTRLILVGHGPLFGEVQTYCVQKLGTAIFPGFINQTELPRFYIAADIFVLPSLWEEFGLVVNEAMCFRLPLLLSDKVAASRDLLIPGKNGFLFSPGDVNMLAMYLQRLIDDPDVREKFGQTSREMIDNWNYKQTVDGIISALNVVSRQK